MPTNTSNEEVDLPAPEVLKPQVQKKSEPTEGSKEPESKKNSLFRKPNRLRRSSYHPSHKATFIGLGVIVAILIINAVIFYVVFQFQQENEEAVNRTEVTLSADNLDELGVSRNPVGDLGTELTVGPDAVFNGAITIGGDATVGGSLVLNGDFSAAQGAFTELQGGNTSLTSLNVNQSLDTSELTVRDTLAVNGSSQLQGTVTIGQLLTVNGNVNVAGNLAVGGTLSVRTLGVNSLSINSSLSVGGKIITRGQAPFVAAGGGAGSNATASISGTDTAGTVAINVGAGGSSGVLVTVTFRGAYSSTPRVVVSPIGKSVGGYYVNRTATGFSISTTGALSPGGYSFDYIIVQ